MTVEIFCIYGNHLWYADSVEKVVQLLREFRRYVTTVDPSMMDAWEEEARKQRAEKFLAPSPSELRRVLRRHGRLRIACLDCNAAVSQEMYRRLGIETVKVGITLVSPELMDDPRMQAQVKEFGMNKNIAASIDYDAILGKRKE